MRRHLARERTLVLDGFDTVRHQTHFIRHLHIPRVAAGGGVSPSREANTPLAYPGEYEKHSNELFESSSTMFTVSSTKSVSHVPFVCTQGRPAVDRPSRFASRLVMLSGVSCVYLRSGFCFLSINTASVRVFLFCFGYFANAYICCHLHLCFNERTDWCTRTMHYF